MNAFKKVLWLLILSVSFEVFANAPNADIYKIVKQYTKESGLPVNAVTDLAIDNTGFLWIATHDGLLRFDGLRFKLYTTINHPKMPGNRIRLINAIDSGGLLVLFGTTDLYLLEADTFSKVAEVTLDSFALHHNELWFGTQHGLFVRDLITGKTREVIKSVNVTSLTLNDDGVFYADDTCAIHFYTHQKQTSTLLTQLDCKQVNEMKATGDRKLAVATGSGVYVIDDTINHYQAGEQVLKLSWVKDRLFTLSATLHVIEIDGTVTELFKPDSQIIYLDPPAQVSENGQVWVNGFSTLQVNDEIAFNSPSSIFKHVFDNQGGLWVATKGDGLFYLRKPIIETVGLQNNQLMTGFVTSIALASDGDYLAAEGSALFRFNPNKSEWHKYDSIGMSRVFLYDSSEQIWVAKNGLCKMDAQEKCIKQPYPVSEFADIQLLFEDSKDQIWVGSDEGLFIYQDKEWQLINSQNNRYIFALEVPDHGTFLASINHGISVFKNNKKTQQIDMSNGLPTNQIRTFYYDPKIAKDAILVGTTDKGLCLWHFDNGLVRCASTQEGLPHYGVHRILPDQKNRLWFSSNNGIYTIKNEDISQYFNHKIDFLPSHRFGVSDGMVDSEANGGVQAAGTVGYQSDLWFPTQQGIVRVPVNDMVFDEKPVSVYIDEVHVGNVLQENPNRIVIDDPKKRDLTVSLSAIALGLSDGVRFRYRTKNSDPWVDLGQSREISFNTLEAGEHNMEFQAARYGNWLGPIAQMNIEVAATLMETIWFRIALFSLILMGLYGWIYSLRKRKDTLEIEVTKRTEQLSSALAIISEQKDTIKEEAQRKQQHFLDLSHELRTPLTLILGPLHSGTAIKSDTQYMMAKNADRLLLLINQMLKLEQLDLFDETLTLIPIPMVSKCRLGLDQFKHEVTNRSLDIEFHCPDYEVNIQGVSEEIDTLLINLFSNAIKFTPNRGIVRLTIEDTANNLCLITIEDNGPGIPETERQQVFDRFVRLNHEKVEGHGLGLTIVKRIVERHEGRINIENSDLGGAKFILSFPLIKPTPLEDKQLSNVNPSKRSVLVIDDNADILVFTESILAPKYQVLTTQFPEDGLKLATRMLPDLIIVDIGMPKINGFELVTRIRKYGDTKNIPVIFVTARAHPDDQVKAMKTGGDAFLTKPYTPEQLLAYVNRLLTSKNQETTLTSPPDSQHKSLLSRAKSIIHQAIENADFGVEQLAAELAMSRSALYRRFKDEVDISPAEYIARCRMEQASQLLRNTTLSVAKVAQMTGFKQVSTFNRSFNRFYGHNPTEHRSQ